MRRITEPALRSPSSSSPAILSSARPRLRKPTLRRFTWSRLHGDLLDDFRWPLVAKRVGAPLPLVEAVIIRLEIYANRSNPRGYVGDFNPRGLAARWDVNADLIVSIFTELSSPDIGWIDQEQVVSFWDRNPDTNDESASERQQRVRDRKKCNDQLERLLAQGQITKDEFQSRKILLKDSKQPLVLMSSWTDEPVRRAVAPDEPNVLKSQVTGVSAKLSTGSVTRDARDVTARSDQTNIIKKEDKAVDNSDANLSGQAESLAGDNSEDEVISETNTWLETVGRKMVEERMQVPAARAETLIERWRRDLQDTSTLAKVMKETEEAGHIGPRFHTIIADRVQRLVAQQQLGPSQPITALCPQTSTKAISED